MAGKEITGIMQIAFRLCRTTFQKIISLNMQKKDMIVILIMNNVKILMEMVKFWIGLEMVIVMMEVGDLTLCAMNIVGIVMIVVVQIVMKMDIAMMIF